MAKKKTKKKAKTTVKKETAKKTPKKGLTSGLATLALILNVIFPGVGSLIGGKMKTGIFQIILISAVLFLLPLTLGILVWVGTVIWGIVTGVKLVQEAQ